MGRSKARYEDIDELVARERGRRRGATTAIALAWCALLLVAVALSCACVFLRTLAQGRDWPL